MNEALVLIGLILNKAHLCSVFPANIYLSKFSKKKSEICLKLTIKRRSWRRPDVFVLKFEHISHLLLVFLLLTLNRQMLAGFFCWFWQWFYTPQSNYYNELDDIWSNIMEYLHYIIFLHHNCAFIVSTYFSVYFLHVWRKLLSNIEY